MPLPLPGSREGRAGEARAAEGRIEAAEPRNDEPRQLLSACCPSCPGSQLSLRAVLPPPPPCVPLSQRRALAQLIFLGSPRTLASGRCVPSKPGRSS